MNNTIYQSISGLLSVLIVNLVFFSICYSSVQIFPESNNSGIYCRVLMHLPSSCSLSGIICCRYSRYIRRIDVSFPILAH